MQRSVIFSCSVVPVILLLIQPLCIGVNARKWRFRQPLLLPRRPQTLFQPYTCRPNLPKQEYLFAVAPDREPHLYYNSAGTLVGFMIDVIAAVCRIAGKTCHWSVIPWSLCSRTINNVYAPGDYLMGGQVDACSMWVSTKERSNSVDFTDPVFLATNVHFTIRSEDVASFDQNDFSGATVVLRDGWFTNEFCLSSNGVTLTGTTFVIVGSETDAIAALKNRDADIFFHTSNFDGDVALSSLVASKGCGPTHGMMVKRGSHLPAWWNPAFNRLVESGGYAELCAAAQTRHNDARRLDKTSKQFQYLDPGQAYYLSVVAIHICDYERFKIKSALVEMMVNTLK